MELTSPDPFGIARFELDRSPETFGCSVRTLDASPDDDPVGRPLIPTAYQEEVPMWACLRLTDLSPARGLDERTMGPPDLARVALSLDAAVRQTHMNTEAGLADSAEG